MPVPDLPMMRCLAARAELAGQQLRQSAATTLAQIASVRWRGLAAAAFDENLAMLLTLVRRTSDDLDRFADTVRRELGRVGTPS
jgi:uncharacterized protein YukE